MRSTNTNVRASTNDGGLKVATGKHKITIKMDDELGVEKTTVDDASCATAAALGIGAQAADVDKLPEGEIDVHNFHNEDLIVHDDGIVKVRREYGDSLRNNYGNRYRVRRQRQHKISQ
jgi:hypothetical protein